MKMRYEELIDVTDRNTRLRETKQFLSTVAAERTGLRSIPARWFMNEQDQGAQLDMPFSQMEGAIESFVETAHLAGLELDDLLVLRDAGLNIKEILEIIAVKSASSCKVDIMLSGLVTVPQEALNTVDASCPKIVSPANWYRPLRPVFPLMG